MNLILEWFAHYKYFIIFPLAVLEGPIITVISGVVSSLGQLNFFITYIVIVVGDVIGDFLFYCIGRFSRAWFIRNFGKYLKITEDKVELLERHFDDHSKKTFIISKISHGVGFVFLIASGAAHLRYDKFFEADIPPTLVKSLVLMSIGYYLGKGFFEYTHVFNVVSVVIGFSFVALYLFIIIFAKKLVARMNARAAKANTKV